MRTPQRQKRSAVEIALLDEGPMFYVVACCTLSIWALELVMNLRHGNGWIFHLHLLVIGPLWLILLTWFLRALYRKIRCDRGKVDPV